MKKTKKILFFVTCLFCLVGTLSFGMKVSATKSDNGNGNWTPSRSEDINVYGMNHSSIWGKANGNNPQHINVLSMKTDGYSSKLVTWSVTNGSKKYTRQTLDVIAKDYEKNHPGWIVIGGINGDQYTTGFGSDIGAGSSHFYPQSYYPLIMDGESRIPITVQNSTSMHVGFANDGSEGSLIASSPVRSFVLSIVDEYKNVIAKFDVNKINEAPGANETTAWSTYMSISQADKYVEQQITTTNNVYVVENPELAYMNNTVNYIGGANSLFARGTISKVTQSVTLKSNQFAIETSNPEVIKALGEGKRIIVDAEYESEALNKVEASTGFHSVHRMNDVDQPLVHTSYDGNRYSRAIIGKKADGTYVLFTADVANDPNDLTVRYAGLNFDECNAALKHYGVTEAYQMDGGGSVTSIYRDENGEFVISNYVRDGVRANMMGLLFVVRDPHVSVKETTYSSVTLKQGVVLGAINSTIENLVVKHNDKSYSFDENGELTIDGLDENTSYDFEISYDVAKIGTTDVKTMTSKVHAQTKLYAGETPKFEITSILKNSFKVTMNASDAVKNVKVIVNDQSYDLTNNEVTITELLQDTTYTVVCKYDLYDAKTQKTYSRETSPIEVTTLSYELPEITSFVIFRENQDKIIFKYAYTDNDDKVIKAELVYGNEKVALNSKNGVVTVSNLDLANVSYEFTVVITYDANGVEKELRSETITAGKSSSEVKHTITYELDGGTLEGAPTEYVEGVGLTSLPKPTKDGYEFDGWYIDGNKVTKIDKEATTDIVLVAKWKAKTQSGGGCNLTSITTKYLVTFITILGGLVIVLRKRK